MIRTQVQLTERQVKELKRLSTERGVSVAELIRVSVDSLLDSRLEIDEESKRQRAMSVVGKYHSGLGDLSTNHDEYLAEDFS